MLAPLLRWIAVAAIALLSLGAAGCAAEGRFTGGGATNLDGGATDDSRGSNAGGSGGGGGGGGAGGAPAATGRALAVSIRPIDTLMKAQFEVVGEIRDRDGKVDATDDRTTVSIKLLSGGGKLGGTLSRTAVQGVVRFEDLEYDRWESVTLELSAPGLTPASTGAILVRPFLRLKDPPAFQTWKNVAIGPITVEVVDAAGGLVALATGQKVRLVSEVAAVVPGGAERAFVEGRATFDSLQIATPGSTTITFVADGLPPLLQAVLIHDTVRVESLWLPAGRVGVPYRATLPPTYTGAVYQLTAGSLPVGLALDPVTGAVSGIPTQARHSQLRFSAQAAGVTTQWAAGLSIFPETETPARSLDAMDADGPYQVGALDEVVNVPSRKKTVRVRLYYPEAEGKVAAGRFPMVVFHHGAALVSPAPTSPYATVYLRYDPLLKRWASHGYVVATIDAADLVNGVALSLTNLTAMSENQRATIAYLRTKSGQAGWTLAGRVDGDRVVVAGHSRGGGASLITLRAEPAVMAAILLKPVDPMMAAGGERIWNTALPARPMLVNIGGNDADTAYPICDFLYERRTSAQAAHTILGTVHNYTVACTDPTYCAPERGSRPQITREQDWAITNAHTIAFLKYVVEGDLGYAPLLFGTPALSTRLSPLGTMVRGNRGAGALVIDDFQDVDVARNNLGQPNGGAGLVTSVEEPSLAAAVAAIPPTSRLRAIYGAPDALAFSNARKLVWTSAGATYRTDLAPGGLDVRGRGAFVLRARSDAGRLTGEQIELKFNDGSVGGVTVRATPHVGANGIGERFSDLIVPLSTLRAAGLEPSRLFSIELKLLAPSGTLFIDDLRFE
jgi:dienelactone hydrolase